MAWENVPGITPEAVNSAWLETETIGYPPILPWLDRWIERRRTRKADAKASEPTGPLPTLPNPMRDPERRWW